MKINLINRSPLFPPGLSTEHHARRGSSRTAKLAAKVLKRQIKKQQKIEKNKRKIAAKVLKRNKKMAIQRMKNKLKARKKAGLAVGHWVRRVKKADFSPKVYKAKVSPNQPKPRKEKATFLKRAIETVRRENERLREDLHQLKEQFSEALKSFNVWREQNDSTGYEEVLTPKLSPESDDLFCRDEKYSVEGDETSLPEVTEESQPEGSVLVEEVVEEGLPEGLPEQSNPAEEVPIEGLPEESVSGEEGAHTLNKEDFVWVDLKDLPEE